jgi:GLPGLI family protein
MLKYLFVLISLMVFQSQIHAADSTSYLCKYRYSCQKDTKVKDSKSDDIMLLEINKSSTVYYSYLKHFGFRNKEADEKKGKENSNVSVSGNMVNIDASKKDQGKYFNKSETEVIKINYKTKQIQVADKLLSNSYGYEIELASPVWKISSDTMTILNQLCQKATTTFKGRNYTAWFASSIPYKYGPWLFNNLPGLILKVEDDKKEFLFECIELNSSNTNKKVFRDYTNVKKIAKNQLQLKKKLMYEDPIGFMEAEGGVTITTTDANTGKPVPRKLKSYNSIELTP